MMAATVTLGFQRVSMQELSPNGQAGLSKACHVG